MFCNPSLARDGRLDDGWRQMHQRAQALAPPRGDAAMTRLRLRFGDACLDLEADCQAALHALLELFGDCTADDQEAAVLVQLKVRLRVPGDGLFALLAFGPPAERADLDLVEHALNLLQHQYLGCAETFCEARFEGTDWRYVVASDAPHRPVLAVREGVVLVDLARESWRFVAGYLVSAAMSVQTNTVFVHAGSVVLDGVGVLLSGPSRSGKTTLSLALAARGHDFYGENIAALRIPAAELLPFRRTALLRPGLRSSRIDRVLREEGIDLPAQDTAPSAPKTLFRTGLRFPPRRVAPVRLGYAFFLEGFAARASVQPLQIAASAFDLTLRPLAFDTLIGASWGGQPGRRLMKYVQLRALLEKVHCFRVEAGGPDETATLIERTVLEPS